MNFKDRFLRNFLANGGEDEEEHKARRKAGYEAGRLGPRSFSTPTSGQLRRAAMRRRASESRKANRRHRREWLAGQQTAANLRGQLLVAQGIIDATPAMKRNATLGLIRNYGSVEKAIEVHAALARG